jgi:predicted Rossmann fold nucleotide-binding protein DprA/Smf involved in DNA uptake
MNPEPQKLAIGEAGYPETLRDRFGALAAPDIWYIGNISLLNTPGVGFCGSRHATEAGLKVAVDCATQLSREGITVVSWIWFRTKPL